MQKNLFKKTSNLQIRIISAVFIGIIFITSFFFFRELFITLLLIIATGMLTEWYNITNKKNIYLYLGLIIIPLPIFCLFYIHILDYTGWLLFTFFAILWSVDSFAMFFGKLLEGPKLAPKLSPHKTISGLLGGVMAAALLPLSLGLLPNYSVTDYIPENKFTQIYQFALLALIAQISDLFISYFKRKVKIKDSGNIIPGHGGMLDRFDSIILTAPALVIYLIF